MRMICALVFFLGIFSQEAFAGRHKVVRTGEWGGPGMDMQVDLNSASIGFDCAGGTIDQPIRTDRNGRFEVMGIYELGHIGAVPVDAPPLVPRPARYFGHVHGNTMVITIELTDTMEIIGRFILTHGQPGRLVVCA